jgi:hypothetical protein
VQENFIELSSLGLSGAARAHSLDPGRVASITWIGRCFSLTWGAHYQSAAHPSNFADGRWRWYIRLRGNCPNGLALPSLDTRQRAAQCRQS